MKCPVRNILADMNARDVTELTSASDADVQVINLSSLSSSSPWSLLFSSLSS